MERELGLLRTDGSPKPALLEMKKFNDCVSAHPLPRHRIDGTVILTEDTDCWGLAFMSFLLAKQAGFDVQTAWCKDKLPETGFYIMPSISNFKVMPKYRYLQLLEKIEKGATLLISSDNAGLQPLEPLGIIIETIFTAAKPDVITSEENGIAFTVAGKNHIKITPMPGTQVLAENSDNEAAFTCATYGKGKILFLNVPLENALLTTSDAFGEKAPHYSRIYEIAADFAGVKRLVKRTDRQITLTEHPIDSNTVAVVAVNNAQSPRETALEIADPWHVDKCINGNFADGKISIAEKTGVILYLKK
jgi:hypothetical protein